ncbi:MAG TPA: zinc ribbon domain-containing protein [Candidatus Hydrogenedentes bacterium]|nr:zinc ribbon domain-containing protein [Candidatus Hydrogenedentota bacterium]HPG66135.1 zinc ribbon domain-containing protein [Candidatus Hydrogenedentota bacterium]
MGDAKSDQELIVSRQVLSIPQRFSTGPVMGRFLRELRDNRRIMANRCPKCGRHQLPPREVCAVCHVEATEWDALGPEGTLRDFDVVYYASPDPLTGETRETPYVLCWADLDGTQGDAPLWHLLDPADLGRVRRGARVRVVFADEREGTTGDIKHFEIIE